MSGQSYSVPQFIVDFLMYRKSTRVGQLVDFGRRRNLRKSDYALYGAGRNLVFSRIAADSLDGPGESRLAEYHAYAGVSALRSSIDSAANWLRLHLKMKVKRATEISLTRPSFLTAVKQEKPSIATHVDALARIAREIDKHRQRAQHREGLALVRYVSSDSERWYLAPRGIQYVRNQDRDIVDLLRDWANRIESELEGMLKAV
jgi:hypothetical protein